MSSLTTQHIPILHKPSKNLPPIPSAQLSPIAAAALITAPALFSNPYGPASAPAAQVVTPQTLPPAQTHIVTAASLQPSVIAHAGSASHASVIQTVNRVIQPGSKHVAHIAPSSSSSVQLAPGPQPISHITVTHLPAIYPQPVTVTQPAVMSPLRANVLSQPDERHFGGQRASQTDNSGHSDGYPSPSTCGPDRPQPSHNGDHALLSSQHAKAGLKRWHTDPQIEYRHL